MKATALHCTAALIMLLIVWSGSLPQCIGQSTHFTRPIILL
jgi:hypothetical protein